MRIDLQNFCFDLFINEMHCLESDRIAIKSVPPVHPSVCLRISLAFIHYILNQCEVVAVADFFENLLLTQK